MRLDCNIYFLLEKQAFNGLSKFIGIQKWFNNKPSVELKFWTQDYIK